MSAILVIGEPGSGKSRAIKNLDPKKTVIIKPNNKPLPFPAWKSMYGPTNMFMLKTFKGVHDLIMGIDKDNKKTGKGINDALGITTVVIEDITHYMSKDVMDNAAVKGYDKWTELAVRVFKNFVELESEVRTDLDIILIGHTATVTDSAGNMEVGLQTAGALLDRAVKIPSYFTYILHAVIDYTGDEPKYLFQTNRDNIRLAKTPEKMFPLHIDNDYKAILDRIHLYDLGKIDFVAEEAAQKKA
jgi:hypothetical protein